MVATTPCRHTPLPPLLTRTLPLPTGGCQTCCCCCLQSRCCCWQQLCCTYTATQRTCLIICSSGWQRQRVVGSWSRPVVLVGQAVLSWHRCARQYATGRAAPPLCCRQTSCCLGALGGMMNCEVHSEDLIQFVTPNTDRQTSICTYVSHSCGSVLHITPALGCYILCHKGRLVTTQLLASFLHHASPQSINRSNPMLGTPAQPAIVKAARLSSPTAAAAGGFFMPDHIQQWQ